MFWELIIVTKVPIPNSIEIDIAIIVPINLTNFFAILCDFSLKKVLFLHHEWVILDSCFEPIAYIFKRLFAYCLPLECPDKYIGKFIISE